MSVLASGSSAALWFVMTACVIAGWDMPTVVQIFAGLGAGLGALDRFIDQYEESYR